jgi:sortase (surface protein transpeptidase)
MAHADETAGALRPIAKLAKGDVVELLTTQGSMDYEVESVRSFDPQTMERVGISLFKQDGGAGRLVLISAEGWNGSTYERSVVVTTDPLGEPVS